MAKGNSKDRTGKGRGGLGCEQGRLWESVGWVVGSSGGTPKETRVEGTRAAGGGRGVCIYTYAYTIWDVLLV